MFPLYSFQGVIDLLNSKMLLLCAFKYCGYKLVPLFTKCKSCADCRICVWNAVDGSLVHSLTGHNASVSGYLIFITDQDFNDVMTIAYMLVLSYQLGFVN